LHYLARAQEADVFVVYDDVQFVRRSPHHRAAIAHGDDEWLTVPVQNTGVETALVEARIDMSTPWAVEHLETLRHVYGEQALELAPFYEQLCPNVLDVDFVRNHPEEILEFASDENRARDALDGFTRSDRQWRRRRERVDDLRAEKNAVSQQVAARKQADPGADIDDLVGGLDDLGQQIAAAETACDEARTRRDHDLVALSETVAAANGQLEWMDLQDLWNLDGLDGSEWLGTVTITDLTVPLLEELFRRFDVTSEVVRSSELGVEHPGDASEYLARLVDAAGGDCYLSGGTGYENYLDEAPFDDRGFDVAVQNWEPTWPAGNVCALDVLYGSDNPGAHIR
jgi:hypothetical protein